MSVRPASGRLDARSVNSVQDRIDSLSCHTCAELNNKHISKTSRDLGKNERFHRFLSRSLLCWKTRSCWLCIGEIWKVFSIIRENWFIVGSYIIKRISSFPVYQIIWHFLQCKVPISEFTIFLITKYMQTITEYRSNLQPSSVLAEASYAFLGTMIPKRTNNIVYFCWNIYAYSTKRLTYLYICILLNSCDSVILYTSRMDD